MASILEIDPDQAGLAQAAGIIGEMSGPSRMPVGIGSILGRAAGGLAQGRNQALMQQAQLQQVRDAHEAKQAAIAEQQKKAKAGAEFNSILGKMQESGEPLDEISILNAGIKSGAFGPNETTNFMSKVVEKKSAREAALEREQLRLADKAIAREEREASERRLVELRAELARDRDRLLAAMRPQAQERLVPVEQPDGTVNYEPASQAVGKKVPPPRRDARGLPPNAIKELASTGETATSFIRLSTNFKDEFGGKGSAFIGDIQNTIGRNLGAGKGDQADWWQDYQNQKNIVRNKLFGSALTATEAAEFDKANINPGMKPEIIRKNLSRQKAAAIRAAKKLSGAYRTGGYNEEQINEALGLSAADLADEPAKDPWE